MKKAMKLLRIVSLGTIATFLSHGAWATDNYKRFPSNFWEFQASTRYFKTEANYSSSGSSFSSLGSGRYFQQLDIDFATRYIWGKNWAFSGGFGIGNAESKDLTSVRTNSALRDASFGVEYLAYEGFVDVIPELKVVVPLETYNQNTDSVMITEGVLEVQPRLTVQKDFGSFNGFTYGGFTYRDQGRSFLLPYGVGAEWKLSGSRIGAELSGSMSITDDEDTNNKTQRLIVTDRVNGGSLYHSAVNPSVLGLAGYYKIRLYDTWVAHFGLGTTLNGTNAAAGYYVTALLRYSFDTRRWGSSDEGTPYRASEGLSTPSPSAPMKPVTETPVSSEKDVTGFQEQFDDGVDQSLFRKASPVVAPEPVAPAGDSGLQIKLKKKKKK